MNTLSDTDERKARLSVWPVYVAAVAVACACGQFLFIFAYSGEYGWERYPTEMVFYVTWIILGVMAIAGLAMLRPWGWWCAAVFAAGWAVFWLVMLLSRNLPLILSLPNLALLALLIRALTTRRQLFFPPQPDGEE